MEYENDFYLCREPKRSSHYILLNSYTYRHTGSVYMWIQVKSVYVIHFISDKQDFSIHIDDILCNNTHRTHSRCVLRVFSLVHMHGVYTRVSFQSVFFFFVIHTVVAIQLCWINLFAKNYKVWEKGALPVLVMKPVLCYFFTYFMFVFLTKKNMYSKWHSIESAFNLVLSAINKQLVCCLSMTEKISFVILRFISPLCLCNGFAVFLK